MLGEGAEQEVIATDKMCVRMPKIDRFLKACYVCWDEWNG